MAHSIEFCGKVHTCSQVTRLIIKSLEITRSKVLTVVYMYDLKEMVGPVFYKGNMGPVCRLLSSFFFFFLFSILTYMIFRIDYFAYVLQN